MNNFRIISFSTFFFLFCPILQSQVYNYDSYPEKEFNELNRKSCYKQKTITTACIFTARKTIIKYDTAGSVTSYTAKNKEVRSIYDKDELKTEMQIYVNGALVSRDSNVWAEKLLQKSFHFNKAQKLTARTSYKYDSTHVSEDVTEKLKQGRFMEFRKVTYEYYPDYAYKKITYYKKGRPAFYTVFDCNPVGEDHKVRKDSSYNCVKYDVDSMGHKIKISVINKKKSSRKIVEYFNEEDQRIAQKDYDLKSGLLQWYIEYLPGSGWAALKMIWYKNGKEKYRSENTYNENGRCTGWVSYTNGKMSGRGVNLYNLNGDIEKSEQFNKRNKRTAATDYAYEYY